MSFFILRAKCVTVFNTIKSLLQIPTPGGEKAVERECSAVIYNGSSDIHGPYRPSTFSDGLYRSNDRLRPLWLRSRRNGTSSCDVIFLVGIETRAIRRIWI